jgi:hypothetical protein
MLCAHYSRRRQPLAGIAGVDHPAASGDALPAFLKHERMSYPPAFRMSPERSHE